MTSFILLPLRNKVTASFFVGFLQVLQISPSIQRHAGQVNLKIADISSIVSSCDKVGENTPFSSISYLILIYPCLLID